MNCDNLFIEVLVVIDEKIIDQKVVEYLKKLGIEPDMNGYSSIFEKTKKTVCEKYNIEYKEPQKVNGRCVD